jgi:hypothetical protein
MIAVFINLMLQLFWTFIKKEGTIVGTVGATCTFVILGLFWGASRKYCQAATRYIFIVWYLLGIAFNIASSIQDSPMFVQAHFL